jgi:uncharacterized membrane protein
VEATLLDWLNLALRWFHVVVAIGWIGASFYFMWVDSNITPPEKPREGVAGELWMVHSGHFYQVEMRHLRPGEMPKVLHWFKWEAALTWISGIALLTVAYYLTGGVYLVDPSVSRISTGGAVALCVGLLILSWVVYDLLWVSPLGRDHARAATAISYALLLGVVIALCRTLSGRAAFIHVGAMLGTIMVANVWMRILPAQRELIAATAQGRTADWTLSDRAKRRSVHNSYVTLPVIFMMVSNHYPSTYSNRLNWLILALFIVVGVGLRHLMITHEKHRPAAWVLAPVAVSVAVLVYRTLPTAPAAGVGARVPFPVARRIVETRCVSCHSTTPTDDIFRAAPNGVAFDTPESIRLRAETIKQRTVLLKNMPLANKTGMSEIERETLGRWIDQGARLDQ